MEIPSYFITWYAMDRLGRRWVLCVTMMLGGLACVSCMFVPEGTLSIQIFDKKRSHFLSRTSTSIFEINSTILLSKYEYLLMFIYF